MANRFTTGKKKTASGTKCRQVEGANEVTALWVVLQIMKLLRETGHRPVAIAPLLWKSRSAPLLIIPIGFLLSAVASLAVGDVGIIKGADQFEFVYHVKLPEITGE